jgi:hypothetical protein
VEAVALAIAKAMSTISAALKSPQNADKPKTIPAKIVNGEPPGVRAFLAGGRVAQPSAPNNYC